MIAAGFGVFLSSLTAANGALPYTIGIAFDLAAAVLFLHVFLAYPSGLLDAVTAAAAIALENARLTVELRARLEELRGSRARLVEAGDSECRRLERNLHDGAQQRLVALALQLRLLENRVRDDPAAAEMASAAGDELVRSLEELRELARGLHPAVLEHGLGAALDALAARSKIPTTARCDVPGRLPEAVELAAYFVAAEALTNVAKYARASAASVRAWRDGPMAVLEVSDDGVGGADDSKGSACAAWPTASRRSTAACAWSVRRAPGRW